MAVDLTNAHQDLVGRSQGKSAATGHPGSPRPSAPPPGSGHGRQEVIATGLACVPGAAVSEVYFTAADAAEPATGASRSSLVRTETSPEDVHGMIVAEGILTSRGGLVSHAAGVATAGASLPLSWVREKPAHNGQVVHGRWRHRQ